MEKFHKRKLGVLLMACFLAMTIKVTKVNANEEGTLQDLPIEVNAEVAIYSKYIWRGFKLDDDTVMQQGIYVSAHRFTAGVWGSVDIDAHDKRNSSELNYIIDYTHEFDKFSLSVGYIYYDFPDAHGESKEFYVGGGLNIPLSPTLTYYHDYGDEDTGGSNGDYYVLELSHSLPVGDTSVSLDLSGHIGYNNELGIDGEGGDIAFAISLSVPLTDQLSISPNINYSIPYGDLNKSSDGDQDDELYFGLLLGLKF